MTSVLPVASASSLSISSARIVADLAEVGGALLVGDLEEQPLGVLDHLARLAVALGDRLLDRLRGRVEAPHQRVLLDDLRVVLGAARRRGPWRRGSRRRPAADRLELAVLGQLLGDA